ncbi:hypothetical protein [Synechococcus sp. 1G10]|uniref:hypothetical protein n=1 Tax=Synechococcus sp. 1G10 TaxID=2025605 RepID=UPI000B993BE6|nr:hypothetical protein [Synechococcus sp. 1G10]
MPVFTFRGTQIDAPTYEAAIAEYAAMQAAAAPTEPPAPAPPVEPTVEPTADTDGLLMLTALAERLDAVENSPAASRSDLLSLQAELQRWSAQAARVSLTHQELASLADQTIARIDATATAADARLQALDARTLAAEQQVAEAITRSDGTAAANVAATASTIADLQARALTGEWMGPEGQRGERGLAAAGCTIADVSPISITRESFAQRYFGRAELLPGDACLEISSARNAVIAWRYNSDGTGWEEGVSIVPKVELVNQSWSATSKLDTSQTVITNFKGSVGGPIKLMQHSLTGGALLPLAIAFDQSSIISEGRVRGFTAHLLLESTVAGNQEMTQVSFTATPSPGGQPVWSEYSVIPSSAAAPIITDVRLNNTSRIAGVDSNGYSYPPSNGLSLQIEVDRSADVVSGDVSALREMP